MRGLSELVVSGLITGLASLYIACDVSKHDAYQILMSAFVRNDEVQIRCFKS